MKIIRNDYSAGVATIEAEFQLERGWFSQYPEFALVIQGPAPDKKRLGDNYYSRPDIPFLDFGPSVQTVTGSVQFPANQGMVVNVQMYTRQSTSDKWVIREKRDVLIGSQSIVEEAKGTRTEQLLTVLVYGGTAGILIWGVSSLIGNIKR